MLVARDEEEATTLYGELLADRAATEELGRRARERALDEHTYAHRARRLLDLLGLSSQAAEPVEAARG
jgi:spore maturation protein CgeB